MKYKSRGVPLTYIKQGDSSIISRIFTEEKGLQTFIVKGVRSQNSKKKISHFEPLKLLTIDADFNAKRSLQYLGDIAITANFDNTKNKIYRSFVGFFIAEVSSKVLQENEQNKVLFNFIWHTAIKLYSSENTDPNFSLKYLLDLSKLLGFYPSLAAIKKSFFDLESGEFLDNKTVLKTYLSKEKSVYLKALLSNQEVVIPREHRLELLKELLLYYKLHHYNLDGITSHLVIEALRR